MIDSVLSTCAFCGAWVLLEDVTTYVLAPSGVHLYWKCDECEMTGNRWLEPPVAATLAQRRDGKVPFRLSPWETEMARWANDLGGDLTVKVFEDAWYFADRWKRHV